MAILNVQLPAGVIPVDGLQVSFKVPCDCASFSHIRIDGARYSLIDTAGVDMASRIGVWTAGAMLSVVLDVTNRAAYLQNAAAAPDKVTFATVRSDNAFAETADIDVTRALVGSCIIPGGNTYNVRCVVDANFFETGDVLEFFRPYAKEMRIDFVNATVVYPGVISANSASVQDQYGTARFVYNAVLGYWIGTGNIT